jgi:uncharacterized membrane protein
MAAIIYSLCALTCLACATLLMRSYRRSGFRLAFWSALCFLGLTVSNVLLVLDRVVYPAVDLSGARLGAAFVAICLLVFGLIWEGD